MKYLEIFSFLSIPIDEQPIKKIIKNMEKNLLRFDKSVVLKEYEKLFDEN